MSSLEPPRSHQGHTKVSGTSVPKRDDLDAPRLEFMSEQPQLVGRTD